MRPIQILFIESDPVNVILAQVVFSSSPVKNEISVVANTDQAMRFLRSKDSLNNKKIPDLIIYDLNNCDIGAGDFIKGVKSDRDFKNIPIIVLTDFMPSQGLDDLYALNVNCFVFL